jgi:[acyl-carrier-protein] S-malonyltransferase
MRPAAERLKEQLAMTQLAEPRIPVVNNVDVAVVSDPQGIRDALYRQAFGPVRWVECVGAIKAMGVSTIVECGPGKVLAGMVKRIDAELTGIPLFDPTTLADAKALVA